MWLASAIRRVQEVLLAGSILSIAVLTIVNVFTRTALGVSLAFAEEVSQFCIIFVTFVGLGYAASEGRHIRMTALYDQLSHRARKALMVVITVGTAALLGLLLFYALGYVGTVYALGTVSPALEVPLFAVYLAAPIGLGLAAVQYALAAIVNLREPDIYVAYGEKEVYGDGAGDGVGDDAGDDAGGDDQRAAGDAGGEA